MLAITDADPADVHALADLLEELDRSYGVTEFDPVDERAARIRQTLFGTRPLAHALLARDGDEFAGMAVYSFLWPAAGLTTSLFLRELYVRQAHWRTGVGRQLMQALCAVAVAEGCSRVEWRTNHDNEQAQGFYEALGVPVYAGKLSYLLDGDALARMAAAAE